MSPKPARGGASEPDAPPSPSRPRDAAEWLLSGRYTVLSVPVPCFEGFVRGRLERWAPDYLRADGGINAHITVLAPFLPEAKLDAATLSLLRETCAAASPFELTLGRLARFADGLVYAVPEPDRPLRALTDAVLARWPALVPYGGIADPVPHLSLDHGPIAPLASELELPTRTAVDRLELVRYAPGDTRALITFTLGSGGNRRSNADERADSGIRPRPLTETS